MASGVECFRVLFPRGADANSYACGSASPGDALAQVVRAAEWLGTGPRPTVTAAPVWPAAATPVTDGLEPDHQGDEGDVGVLLSAAVVEPPDRDPLGGPAPEAPARSGPSPVPPAPATASVGDVVGDEWRCVLGGRRWRVRGLARVTSFEALRLNVMVTRDSETGPVFHVDTLDLYSARARAVFTKAAAAELDVDERVIHADLGRVVLACEAAADDAITAAQTPVSDAVVLSQAEETAALGLLRDPHLTDRIVADFARVGMVGEATNALVGYLAAVSRKLDAPLAVIVQSTSAAGKSSLMDAVLGFVPEEDRVQFSAMTGQSLFYMGETDLAHKVLAVVEEEGAQRPPTHSSSCSPKASCPSPRRARTWPRVGW